MNVGLSDSIQKEELSICYTHTLSAWRCINFEQHRIDNDSIDIELIYRGKKNGWDYSSPSLWIQLKSTSVAKFNRDGNLRFKINKKNYNDLRKQSQTPRILVVLCLQKHYVECNNSQLIINGNAYWISLLGRPPLSISQNSITINIPKTNIITDNTFVKMLENTACSRPLAEGL
jgi:hypothetical protein